MSFNPDYNIEQISKNNYCIRISLSGFKISELDIMLENNILLIKSNEKYNQDDSGKNSILHQGIYKTSFEMRFKLADNVKVSNAVLTDGMKKHFFSCKVRCVPKIQWFCTRSIRVLFFRRRAILCLCRHSQEWH